MPNLSILTMYIYRFPYHIDFLIGLTTVAANCNLSNKDPVNDSMQSKVTAMICHMEGIAKVLVFDPYAKTSSPASWFMNQVLHRKRLQAMESDAVPKNYGKNKQGQKSEAVILAINILAAV